MEINCATQEFYSLMLKYIKKYTWNFYHINNSSISSISCIATNVDAARNYIILFIKDLEKKVLNLNKDITMIDIELNEIMNRENNNSNISDKTLVIGLQLSKDILVKNRLNIIKNCNANVNIDVNNVNNTYNMYDYSLNMDIITTNNINMTLSSLINNILPEITNFNNITFN